MPELILVTLIRNREKFTQAFKLFAFSFFTYFWNVIILYQLEGIP